MQFAVRALPRFYASCRGSKIRASAQGGAAKAGEAPVTDFSRPTCGAICEAAKDSVRGSVRGPLFLQMELTIMADLPADTSKINAAGFDDEISRDTLDNLICRWPTVVGELKCDRVASVSIDYAHVGEWFEETDVRFLDSSGQSMDLEGQLMKPIDYYEDTMLIWLYVRIVAYGEQGAGYRSVAWTLCEDPLSPP
jgi:hypothetical protein